MSDFDPGPGWREVTEREWLSTPIDADHLELASNGKIRHWVREVPVPPLPTAPYTVIRVTWLSDNDPMVFTLYEDDRWHDDARGKYRADHISGYSGFVVLSEPRAVTAKAVLDAVEMATDGAFPTALEQVGSEFGVES